MFSLIVTIISIALVAALAVTSMYYGGVAYNSGFSDAKGGEISAKGQQIMAATLFFHQQRLVWPDSIDHLVSEGFLKRVPDYVAEAPSLFSTASAASGLRWEFLSPNAKHLLLRPVDGGDITRPVCAAVNKRQRFGEMVRTGVDSNSPIQCLETPDGELIAVFLNPNQIGRGTTGEANATTSEEPGAQVCHDFSLVMPELPCGQDIIS